MLVAITIGTIAFFFDVQWLVWAAAGLLVVGIVVGWALSRAGYGVGGSKVSEKAH